MRTLLTALLMALLLVTVAQADDIYLIKGSVLHGKVVEVTDHIVVIVVGDTNKGIMRIPRAQVARIVYDFNSRWDALAEEDAEGQMALLEQGHDQMGLLAPLLERTRTLVGNDELDVAIRIRGHKLLAKIYLKQGDRSRAREQFVRLQTLDAANAAKWAKMVAKLADVKPKDRPVDPTKNVEGLEANAGWKVQQWGQKPSDVEVIIDKSGNKLYAVSVEPTGKKGKTVVSLRTTRLDLSKKDALSMMVFSRTKQPIKLAIALATPFDSFYESNTVTILPNRWNPATRVRFNLKTKNWKCAKTKWRYSTEPKGLNQIVSITLVIYNGNSKGSIFFDNIKGEDPAPPKAPAPAK